MNEQDKQRLDFLKENSRDRRPVILVLGPLSLRWNENPFEREQDTRSAEEICETLWDLGFTAVCPQACDRFIFGSINRDILLEGYLEQAKACDAILALKGWQNSEETVWLLQKAHELMLLKFFSIDSLCHWFDKRC